MLVEYRWNDIYEILSGNDEIQKAELSDMIKEIINLENNSDTYVKLIKNWKKSLEYEQDPSPNEKMRPANLVRLFSELDLDLFYFFQKIKEDIDKMNWSLYVSTKDMVKEPPKSKKRILWVDDNPQNNKDIVEHFQYKDVVFDISSSTDEALSYLSQQRYDLIISDMKRGDNPKAGLELIRNTKNHIGYLPPTFIYSSRTRNSNIGKKAIEEGALLVAVSTRELVKKIETLIATS